MAFINSSANMSLPIPAVGVELGPQYAIDINNALTILDSHDHSPGLGVPVTAAGLNINTDLTIQSNNLTAVRTVRFSAQNAPINGALDLGAAYDVLGDLYYNDGVGNQVRITQNGGVAGTPGSITGMTGGANVSYVAANQTFVFQSAVNTPGNIDGASFILRNLTAGSNGLTLNPPTAMGTNFSLTLPNLPAQQSFMTLDAAGNMSAPWTVDNSTIKVVANQLAVQVPNLHIYGQHAFEANGPYSRASSFPQTSVDGYKFFNFNATIIAVWIYNLTPGTSGTTEFDLKVASPAGTFTSIMSTTGKILSTAAANIWTDNNSIVGAQTGVVKPVLSNLNILAGQALRFDIIQTMVSANDCGVIVQFIPT